MCDGFPGHFFSIKDEKQPHYNLTNNGRKEGNVATTETQIGSSGNGDMAEMEMEMNKQLDNTIAKHKGSSRNEASVDSDTATPSQSEKRKSSTKKRTSRKRTKSKDVKKADRRRRSDSSATNASDDRGRASSGPSVASDSRVRHSKIRKSREKKKKKSSQSPADRVSTSTAEDNDEAAGYATRNSSCDNLGGDSDSEATRPGAVAVQGINGTSASLDVSYIEESGMATTTETPIVADGELVDEAGIMTQARDHVVRAAVEAKVVNGGRRWIALAICLVFALSLGLGLGVGVTRGSSTISPGPSVPYLTTSPTMAPTRHRLEELRDVLESLSGDALYDPSTPQYEALDWVANVDLLQLPIDSDNRELIERYGLVLFYYAANGPSWERQFDFLSATSVCSWNVAGYWSDPCFSEGVFCDSDGFVNEIFLSFTAYDDIRGTLPTEIFALTGLQSIHLSGSGAGLQGTLPSEIGNLRGLERLYLQRNGLSGTLPTELGLLGRLRQLHLYGNSFQGQIPTSLSVLSDLTALDLGDNSLSGSVPSLLGRLTHLTKLHLWNNDLRSTIPTEIGLLTSLTHLHLDHNRLTGSIPSHIGRLSALVWLYLNDNELTGPIPREILDTQRGLQLRSLILSNNKLVGTVHSELGLLPNLEDLDLSSNYLTGTLPTELGQLSKLSFLDVSFNALKSQIPPELGRLESLFTLILASNSFVGGIPSQLAAVPNWQQDDYAFFNALHLQDNQLSGELPTQFGRIAPRMRDLRLYGNPNLTGDLTSFVCPRPDTMEVLEADCQRVSCDCCTTCYY